MKMSNVLSLPHTQGWEQCVCLDMNQFYLGLVPQPERQRVERLEPFDEFEVRCSPVLAVFTPVTCLTHSAPKLIHLSSQLSRELYLVVFFI